jgi:hypothetical protein
MTDITYNDLREQFINKCKRQDEWQNALTSAVYQLGIKISQRLEAPATWVEPITNKEHRYVEVISLGDREVPSSPPKLWEEITKRGELPVGISITLDRNQKTYPKTRVFYAVAVRFSKQTVQYCLWDAERSEPSGKSVWSEDGDSFAEDIISRLKRFVEHDPFDGFDKRISVGFIQER